MKRIIAVFGLIGALAACAADQAPPPAHSSGVMPPKINLDVQAINLADRSGLQPVSSPYNGNRFSPTISDAIKQWAGDRLQAAGQSGQAIIVIKDASLIAQPLPITQGIDGWFTRQQGVKYIGRAEVSVEANGHQGFAMTDAVATRSVTLPENPTAVEKQDAYFTLLNSLMKDLGQNLESGIASHMGSFIVGPQAAYGATSVSTGDVAGNVYPALGEFAPVVIQSPLTVQNTAIAPAPMAPAPVMPAMASSYAVAQPVMNVSQAPQNAAPSYQAQQATVSSAPLSVSPMAPPVLPPSASAATVPMTSQPAQPPVFGNAAVPTVPDLASTPGSIPQQISAAQPTAAPVPLAPQPFSGYTDANYPPVALTPTNAASYASNTIAAPGQTTATTVYSPQPLAGPPATIPLSAPAAYQ